MVLLLFGSAGCSRTSQLPPKDPDLVIMLRWIQSYPGQSRANVDMGLYWALSFLGAKLPAEAAVLSWDGTLVTLDLDAAGVAQATRPSWKKLLQVLKSSDEYRMMGGIDIGRFVFLSLCSSYQYYALTGVSPSYATFRARHTFASKQVAIVESAVAHGNRLIEVAKGDDFASVAFVAFEGSGALRDHSFQKADIETLDLMENGQLRFGLYDLEGHLKAATTPALTAAGKPSKCLWCHEINLQPPFRNVTDLEGYYSTKEFKEIVANATRVVARYRKTLDSKVDFKGLQDHSQAEALYLSFAEPTASRLASEWNVPLDRVRELLASRNLQAHPHSEAYDDHILGDELYNRNDVDSLGPYAPIRGSSDMREASSYEPNLLQ
ncbi:MAG TPA: hypothetical protein VGI65_19755 [Steroidobacteraceae bacterium]